MSWLQRFHLAAQKRQRYGTKLERCCSLLCYPTQLMAGFAARALISHSLCRSYTASPLHNLPQHLSPLNLASSACCSLRFRFGFSHDFRLQKLLCLPEPLRTEMQVRTQYFQREQRSVFLLVTKIIRGCNAMPTHSPLQAIPSHLETLNLILRITRGEKHCNGLVQFRTGAKLVDGEGSGTWFC